MPVSVATESSAWRNQFAQPTPELLLDGIEEDGRRFFELTREGLLELSGCKESLGWHGIPWRWSFSYTIRATTRAYLVPEPNRPGIAMPIRAAEIDAINLRSVSRSIREGVVNAAYVAGVLWAEWELSSATQVNELLDFQHKLIGVKAKR